MNALFVHQNFPGQFRFLAPALAALGWRVVATTLQRTPLTMPGVHIVPYRVGRGSTPGIHPWVMDFETKTIRAEACFRAALQLRDQGWNPDVIIAHPGWGESLFLKDVWPQARLGIYCEFFYRAQGADVGFDPEFPVADPGEVCRLRLKNLNNLLHCAIADAGLAPTRWQASTFPEPFRQRISVIHDGIDTTQLVPNPNVRVMLNERLILTRQDEVITFVNRHLEPYRGYHIFMRALPELLKRRPRSRVLIVGGDGVGYGSPPPGGRTWRETLVCEVRSRISDPDWERVHFLGQLAYSQFTALLQLSTVHVYLTYPFVLSWSLLEAMSMGAAIVASATPPVQEVICHDENGWLVDFFDTAGLVKAICRLLEEPATRARLGQAARHCAQTDYDLRTVCLPRQLTWVTALAEAVPQSATRLGLLS